MKQPRFYLLGDSSAKNPSAISKAQIELWEREGIIEYLGVCDDVRGIIEACDCVVLPSYKEGAPRILLEAMALSKPIITTDTAGCKDCIKAPLKSHNGVLLGENGILVPLKDSLALKEAMCHICENPHLLKSMGESGAEFAKRFDVRGVVEIYKKAISYANSSLGETFRPFENFEHSQTHSLASRPKFSKEAKAFTLNTRILRETQESQGDSITSSLRGEAEAIHLNIFCNSNSKNFIDSHSHNGLCDDDFIIDCHDSATQNLAMTEKGDSAKSSCLCEGAKQPKQSINQINPHAVRTLKGVVGGGERLRGEGLDFAIRKNPCIQAPSPLAEKAISDSRNLAESRRSERVESQKDSIDSIDSSDFKNIDCHDLTSSSLAMTANGNFAESSNDASLSSLRGDNSPKQSTYDSTENDLKDSIYCHEDKASRNDERKADSQKALNSRNDGDFIVSHDSTTQNLAMTESPESPNYTFSQDSSHFAESPKHSPTKALAFISNTCFGMWNFRLPVLKSLQKDGFAVHILAPTDTSTAKLENEGFFVHSISVDSKGLNPLKDIKTAMQIRKILATIKPSVVFSYTIKCVIYGSFVANMLKIPNIAIITGLGYVFIGQSARKKILQNIVSKMYAIALRKTKSVWFLNNDDKSEFIKRHIIAESKSFLLNSEGVDLEHFSPKAGVKSGILPDRIEGEIRFILIARMLWDKGVGEFVEAARKIVDSTTAMGGG